MRWRVAREFEIRWVRRTFGFTAATRLKESRAIELAALTSGEVREEIAWPGVALVKYSIVNPFWPGRRATPPDENVSART
jgi:hypothetical protein